MGVSIHDYLLDHESVDWSNALAGWAWLLPPEFTLWLVNRFCDLIIVDEDGAVSMLDVGAGTLTKLAADRDQFAELIDAGTNAEQWLMMPLVDRLAAQGIRPGPGECYGFRMPPILGGEYTVENCAVLPIEEYLGACGSIHDQLRDVPDGAQVVLKVAEPPV